jgi:hypothetical protein
MRYSTAEEITTGFINDGWSKDISFTELSLQEAEDKGYYFAINGIKKGRKYYKMSVTGNIFNDNGRLSFYNIPCINHK